MIVLDSGDKLRGIATAAAVIDYTIYGLQGTVLKQLADGQLPSSLGDLYTASNIVVISTIIFVNTDSVQRDLNLYLLPSGGTARRIISKDCSLASGQSLHWDGKSVQVFGPELFTGVSITSIQQGTASFSGAGLTATAAINAVDLSKSIILNLNSQSSATPSQVPFRIDLTNTTTVTVTRGYGGEDSTVRFIVIEFATGINNIQRGTIELVTQVSNTDTITTVDLDKAFITHQGIVAKTSGGDGMFASVELLNASTVKAENYSATAELVAGYQVVEFS